MLPGCAVVTAPDGNAGILQARTHDPDVILLDILMPGLDGFQVCRQVKADAVLRDTPVVFLTALGTNKDSRIKALEAGAEGFLGKPPDELELVAQVRAMARLKAANLAARRQTDALAGLVAERTQEFEREFTERRRVEEDYQRLFNEMLVGFAIHELVLDEEGVPVDYRFLAVNPAFERMTGLLGFNLVGKTTREVLPGLEPHWLETYAKVALTGEAVTFTRYGRLFDKFFEVRAFRTGPLQFACVFGDVTERQRAETALRTSEERLRTTLMSIGDGVLSTDPDGTVDRMNQAAEKLTGWTEAEARGKPLGEVFCLQDKDAGGRVENLVARVQYAGGVVDLSGHTLLVARDGVERFIAASGAPIRSPDGRASGVVLVCRDQTEERRARQAFEDSEVLLRIAGRTARFGGWSVDLSTNQCAWSDEVAAIHEKPAGYAPPVSEGISFYAPAWRERITHVFGACARDGVPYDEEMEIINAGGRQVWVRTTGEAVRDGEGRITRVQGSFQDISERKRVEVSLRASQERYRALVHQSPDAVFVNRNNRVVFVNDAALRLFGATTADQVLGQSPYTLFDPSYHETMRKRIVTLLSGHSVPLVTGKVRRLDGTLLDAEIAASPFVDVEGPAIQVVLRDVTERERLRREREALQASLAQSDRLSSMGMLAAGVAHEINNPLSYVLYNVESLAEELPRLAQAVELCRAEMGRVAGADVLAEVLGNDLDLLRPANLEDMAQRLQDAVSGARQIREIARGLGTFSRVEETTHAPVNLQACIDHACIMAHNEIKYRARLVKDYAVTPPVLGSQGKLAQVLLNLLINAAHATDEGHVEDNQVRVRTSVEGDNVVVEVSDTGKGIAPEHREKVFEPFFTTKGVGVGSGLGLAICRRIMGEHNGTIELFSEVGRGTTFRLVLPRMPADWAPAGGTKGKGGALAAAAVRGRVLVVDDEVGVRQVVVRVLSKEHEVVAVSSGDEARELLQRDRGFDLIYCDLMMPRMSGMELHAWLAETDAALAGQVVFLTGGAFTPAATDYLARVGNLRVEKPFNAHDLQKLSAELVLAARAKRA